MKFIALFLALTISILSANSFEEEKEQRYYGGYSENKLSIVKSKHYTAPIVVTEEVFNAKKPEDIDKIVEKQREIEIKKGLSAKEFLEENSGHLYGGIMENR